MTDNWFLQDIEYQLKNRKRVVIIDPKGQCGFFMPLLEKKGYHILETSPDLTERWQTVKEELFLRHKAETELKDEPIVFYVTREQGKLSFLMDYCFTHGCMDLSNPIEWLKKKIFANTGLQIQQDKNLLWVYAKEGMGKDVNWWKSIIQGLQDPIALDDKLLPFLNDPDAFAGNLDKDVRYLFEIRVFADILGQPFMAKPPKTIADEVVKRLLDGLVYNDISPLLLNLYYKWADSEQYRCSLEEFITKYHLAHSTNPWAAHPDHCVAKLDHFAIAQLSANLRDKTYIAEKITRVKVRANSQKAKMFVPPWWHDVITLIECDTKPLSNYSNLKKVVDFYITKFAKVDRAIRNLYAAFLQEEKIIRPLQEFYENLNHELLQKWFEYTSDYKSEQQGYLATVIKSAKTPVAVIVGDGIRYEIADYIASSLEKQFRVDKQIMLADLPSETENNMSALFVGNSEVLSDQGEREKRLTQFSGKNIVYQNLEGLHYGIKADYLILKYGDIDYTGEKLQHGAIKLFEEFERVLKDKIALLLNMGFAEVHLLTDHGFVLTGLLEESDKIDQRIKGKKKVSERYILTSEKQNTDDLIGFERPYGEYKYVYFSKNHRPFKSTGAYGYSHGGFTPQEVIVPKFIFTKEKQATSGLEVKITNKPELEEVSGELFGIKLQGSAKANDLFAANRKVQVMLFAGGKTYNSSSIISLDAGQATMLEFSFQGNTEIQAVVIDVSTQEQLDAMTIRKSTARDLNGLLN